MFTSLILLCTVGQPETLENCQVLTFQRMLASEEECVTAYDSFENNNPQFYVVGTQCVAWGVAS